ncbi:hypothetical protein SAY86_010212 [Trapa natans]|uniref:Uncharacterized protein n=1 Tax=Trapa natans TaxID=22666 RepID=A0AAN7QQX2_TRANT|nr:hypothetical protein SAY86_010212 [Trapa natans]
MSGRFLDHGRDSISGGWGHVSATNWGQCGSCANVIDIHAPASIRDFEAISARRQMWNPTVGGGGRGGIEGPISGAPRATLKRKYDGSGFYDRGGRVSVSDSSATLNLEPRRAI